MIGNCIDAMAASSSSPLRIESVAPTFNNLNKNRTMHRSYSTLGINYMKRIPIERFENIISDKTRSKQNNDNDNGVTVKTTPATPSMSSTSTSTQSTLIMPTAMSRLQNGNTGENNNMNNTGQNHHYLHGFWRIQRTLRDKEKTPDRINLDRRGLTTLPIIDNEPNLRLLSLQHNLINSFCVPISVAIGDTTTENITDLSSSATTTTLNAQQHMTTITDVAGASNLNGDNGLSSRQSRRIRNNDEKRLIRTQSQCQKPSSSSSSSTSRKLYLNKATTPTTNIPINENSNNNNSELSKHSIGFVKQKNQITKNPISIHGKEKFMLKRSNSFISNYSRHLGVSKAQLGRMNQTRINGNVIGQQYCGKLVSTIGRMSSVSSDSTPEIELKPPDEMLIVKRDPFSGFAESYQNIVFLDLYDNQIERISNLDGLKCLTVLLLGKNRITDISGIISVKNTLRVLDLHGNKITNLSQKISQLQELRSLNLAGNSLKQILHDDFKNLIHLKELNLKRNKIRKLNGFDDFRSLERLWLCHNDLQKIDDMSAIAKAINLKEITVDNNPVSLGGDCVSFLVSYLPNLTLLSQMHVTEQVRRAAIAWRKNKEQSDTNYSHLSNDVSHSMRREEVISNARINWELLRSQQHHIGKSSQFIYKTLNSSTKKSLPLTMVNGGDSDAGSVLSENVIVDRKLIRQKTQVIRKQTTTKRPVTTKQRRSVSIDRIPNDTKSTIDEPKDVRLPPISIAIVDVDTQKENENPTKLNLETISKKCDKQINANIECATEPQNVNNSIAVKEQTNEISNNELSNISSFSSKTVISDEKPAIIPKYRGTNHPRRSLLRAQTAKPAVVCSPTTTTNTTMITTTAATIPTSIMGTPSATTSTNSTISSKQHKSIISDREREQGGDYLIEICGRYLNVYGSGAIKFIDRQWNTQKSNDVHTVKFSYVNFNSLASMFSRLKSRFIHAEHFIFRDTNIEIFGQLNSLADLQGLTSLTIDTDGNSICEKQWRSYAIYRLTHWGLKTINNVAITDDEISIATAQYKTLSDLILWSLPDTTIEPLLTRLHFDEPCAASKLNPKEWLLMADESFRNVVSKEALQWKPNSHGEQELRKKGKKSLNLMTENMCNAVHKLHQIESIWPKVLLDVIKKALDDYSNMEGYQRRLMRQIEFPYTSSTPTNKK